MNTERSQHVTQLDLETRGFFTDYAEKSPQTLICACLASTENGLLKNALQVPFPLYHGICATITLK